MEEEDSYATEIYMSGATVTAARRERGQVTRTTAKRGGMKKTLADIRQEVSKRFPAGPSQARKATAKTTSSSTNNEGSETCIPAVVLLSRPGCRHCKRAEDALTSAAIPFEELSLSVAQPVIRADASQDDTTAIPDESELFKIIQDQTGEDEDMMIDIT